MDFIFVILYISFPMAIIFMMKYTGIGMLRVSIPSFVILSMFAFAYVGTLPLYFGWDSYRYQTGVQDKMIMLNVFWFTSWTIFAMVCGYVCTKYALGLGIVRSLHVNFRTLHKTEMRLLFILLMFCFCILGVYLLKVQKIALFVLFSEGKNSASLARSLMGNDFAGKYHRYHLVMHHFMNIATFTFFANWLIHKSRSNFMVFVLAFLGSTFAAIMAIEKAPFGWLLVGIFLTFLLIRRDGKIPIVSLLKMMVPLLSVLVLFYVFFMGSRNPFSALMSVFSRVFTGGIQPAYHYLEFFPKHQDFLMGQSFPNPAGLFPFEPYRLTVEVMNWRFPDLAAAGVVGSMPTVFWGEMYANFGLIGVFIAPFFVGVALYTVASIYDRLENTPIKAGLLVWLILHYRDLSVTGLSGFMIDSYLCGALGMVFMIISLSNHGKIKYSVPLSSTICDR